MQYNTFISGTSPHKDGKNRGNYKLLKLLNYVKSAKYCGESQYQEWDNPEIH